MQKTIPFLLPILGSIFMISGCTRDTDLPVADAFKTAGVSKIKKVVSGTNIEEYRYDSAGRLKTQLNHSGSKIEFTYNNYSVTESYLDINGAIQHSKIVQLDNNGLATSCTFSSDPGRVYLYFYTPEKYLQRSDIVDNGAVTSQTYYFYNNGNLLKDSTVMASGGWAISCYEYYFDVNSTIRHENFGIDYYGMASRNSLKKITVTNDTSTGYVVEFTHPVLDVSDRIIKESFSFNGGALKISAFQYY